MRPSLFGLALLVGCAAAPVRQDPAAAAPSSSKPVVHFGGFDVFGARHEPVDEIVKAFDPPPVGTVIGHPNPTVPKFMAAREAIAKRFPFVSARINYAEFADMTEYVVVEWVDRGDEWRLRLDPAPTGHLADPGGLFAAWDQYRAEYESLVEQGAMPEMNDDPEHKPFGSCRGGFFCSGGYAHPKLAGFEQQFIDGVPRHLDELARVLHEDADPAHRYDAACLLAYAPSREAAVQALLPSTRDPDQGVRNEVLQILGAAQNGLEHVILPLDPFLDALWVPEESDRNKAGWALARITAIEHGAHAAEIAGRAGEALAVMAGMHSRLDYEPAQRVLREISGEDHGSDSAAWRAWVARERK
jgi:hypothetical protein